MELDTGASVSIISETDYNKHLRDNLLLVTLHILSIYHTYSKITVLTLKGYRKSETVMSI